MNNYEVRTRKTYRRDAYAAVVKKSTILLVANGATNEKSESLVRNT